MTLEEVREFAHEHGVLSLHKFSSKVDLIRLIQLSMGREECFGEECIFKNKWCEWKDECAELKKASNGCKTWNA